MAERVNILIYDKLHWGWTISFALSYICEAFFSIMKILNSKHVKT